MIGFKKQQEKKKQEQELRKKQEELEKKEEGNEEKTEDTPAFKKKKKKKDKKEKKLLPAEIRVQSDLKDLDQKWAEGLHFDDVNSLLHFTFTLRPDEGIWKGHPHVFDVTIPKTYPIQAPKVICKTKLFHPNFDQDGHICLNILREDWKPVLTLNAIFTGLHFLFLDPNPDDPLDKEAADMYANDRNRFIRVAQNYMRGIYRKY